MLDISAYVSIISSIENVKEIWNYRTNIRSS